MILVCINICCGCWLSQETPLLKGSLKKHLLLLSDPSCIIDGRPTFSSSDLIPDNLRTTKVRQLLPSVALNLIGILNIDKPQGITSRKVVNHVCALAPKKTRVGHCGTLDPLATGVLLVCVGPATRLIQFGQAAPKHYVGTFRLGVSSDTEDITGNVQTHDRPEVTREQLESVLPKFIGRVEQRPPSFSALRVEGKRAYDLARAGKEVNLKLREIDIFSLSVVDFNFPDFRLDIKCGSGTYVRSLGRDVAEALGTHAVMTELVRSGIGDFQQADAVQLDGLNRDNIEQLFLPPQSMIKDMAKTELVDDEFDKLQDGNWIRRDMPEGVEDLAAYDSDGRLVVVLKRDSGRLFVPKINFAHYWKAVDG